MEAQKRNVRLHIEYDGSRYDGWQRLGTTDNTIQEKIETVLSKMTDETIEIIGSGRTDAGVHAYKQVANFKTNSMMDTQQIKAYLNRYLPQDIVVIDAADVEERFHSRYHAISKKYVYTIWNVDTPTAFYRKFTYHDPRPLDIHAMQQAAAHLVGEHDFLSFCSNKHMKKSTIRTIYGIDIWREKQEVKILVHGNGFLYNMVRIIVGTLIEVGIHKRQAHEMREILQKRERKYAGETAPAQGLVLYDVEYE